MVEQLHRDWAVVVVLWAGLVTVWFA